MTSSNGNIFRVTGIYEGNLQVASEAELRYFRWSSPEKNGWAYIRDDGDLRRHRANYNIIVMKPWWYNNNRGKHNQCLAYSDAIFHH